MMWSSDMHFYQNYYDTGQTIRGRSARAEFYSAIVEYYFTGEKPQVKSQIAQVAFQAVLPSIEKQMARKGAAESRWSRDANEMQTECKRDAKPMQTRCKADASKESIDITKVISIDSKKDANKMQRCPDCGAEMQRVEGGWLCDACGDFGQVWSC